MSSTVVSRNFTMKVVAALVAVAMVFGGIMFASAEDMSADPNRDRLRPDCEWDLYSWWVQYCQVFSSAMDHSILAQIKATTGGDDTSLYMFDGPWGLNKGVSGQIWSDHIAWTFANDNIIPTTPTAGDGSSCTDWDDPALTAEDLKIQKWETFLTQELPVHLQRGFGVNPNRNAIVGLSVGVAVVVVLAARHRDQFKQVTLLSGHYQMSNPVVATDTTVTVASAGVISPVGMWGLPAPVSPERRAHDPSTPLNRLQGLPMCISSAQDVQSLWSDPEVLNRPAPRPPDTMWRAAMEPVSHASTQRSEQDACAAGLNMQFVYSPNGIHSWEP